MILSLRCSIMRNLAIIPARSGSKGLKDKNIKSLAGKPLMVYSIEAALQSGLFSTVMVSTNSEVYAEIARKSNAEVPFLRSERTSSDFASSWDAVEEVLVNYEKQGQRFDTFCLLQPTSPLRTAHDIEAAYDVLLEYEANSVVSLCETDHSPEQCNILPRDRSLTTFIKQSSRGKRRQDMPTYYRFNGAIYIAKIPFFEESHDIYRDKSFAYIMEKETSIDIDDELDFIIAEAVLNNRHK